MPLLSKRLLPDAATLSLLATAVEAKCAEVVKRAAVKDAPDAKAAMTAVGEGMKDVLTSVVNEAIANGALRCLTEDGLSSLGLAVDSLDNVSDPPAPSSRRSEL